MFTIKKLKKLTDPQVGNKCVVLDDILATIYTIKALSGKVALLTYNNVFDESETMGGEADASSLLEPSKEQLEHDQLLRRIVL